MTVAPVLPHTHHKPHVDNALHVAADICRESNLRFTKLRRTVLAVIWNSPLPIKAYDILAQLDALETDVKPPTVYRILNFLQTHGFIHKINSLKAYVGCAHPHAHPMCHLLVCDNCSRTQECCSAVLEQAVKGTASKNNFDISHATLEIQGRCIQCN